MTENESFPLRVTDIHAAALNEWRTGDELPPLLCENWQLVYVCDGAIEEYTDDRKRLLRAGSMYFHQPNERHAMRAVGEVPPVVLRVEFECAGPSMDTFRNRATRASTAEKVCLRQLGDSAAELFEQPDGVTKRPVPRAETPFGANQLAALAMEYLLVLAYRRLNQARRMSPRAVAEKKQEALVEGVMLYFSKNLTRELKLEEICTANGCGRVRLQQAFRTRTQIAPMEYFSRMRLERAGQLLALGHTPGEVAKMLGYTSGAYFSHRFTQAVGVSPMAYRRNPYPLQLCNK